MAVSTCGKRGVNVTRILTVPDSVMAANYNQTAGNCTSSITVPGAVLGFFLSLSLTVPLMVVLIAAISILVCRLRTRRVKEERKHLTFKHSNIA